jgi:hypothetical protein
VPYGFDNVAMPVNDGDRLAGKWDAERREDGILSSKRLLN